MCGDLQEDKYNYHRQVNMFVSFVQSVRDGVNSVCMMEDLADETNMVWG